MVERENDVPHRCRHRHLKLKITVALSSSTGI